MEFTIKGFWFNEKKYFYNFDLFDDFLNNETRYSMLKAVNKKSEKELLEQNKMDAIDRFNYYKNLSEK